MRIGDAMEKVAQEMSDQIKAHTGVIPGDVDDLSLEDMGKLADVAPALGPYLYDGSAKDFISSRSKKRAVQMIEEIEASGFNFSEDNLGSLMDRMTDDLIGKWHTDMLQIFAMGYSFKAPEFADVPRDKDGFLKLCREVDRSLITIQVTQFAADEKLRDIIEQRINLAAAFISHMFAMMGKPGTKFGVRDWFYQVHATVSLNCFLAGHQVRDLLEEELAFEAMMKETD